MLGAAGWHVEQVVAQEWWDQPDVVLDRLVATLGYGGGMNRASGPVGLLALVVVGALAACAPVDDPNRPILAPTTAAATATAPAVPPATAAPSQALPPAPPRAAGVHPAAGAAARPAAAARWQQRATTGRRRQRRQRWRATRWSPPAPAPPAGRCRCSATSRPASGCRGGSPCCPTAPCSSPAATTTTSTGSRPATAPAPTSARSPASTPTAARAACSASRCRTTTPQTHRIYLYWSTTTDNRIGYVTLRPQGSSPRLTAPKVILTGIPHGFHHNGGRIAFGPDGMLYAGTGEAEQSYLAQDKSSLGRQDPADDAQRRPGAGQPVRHRRLQLWPPQRAGPDLGLRGPPVRLRVRRPRQGRAQLDPAGPQLRLAREPGQHHDPADSRARSREFGTEEDSPSGIALVNGSVFMGALAGQRLWRIPLDGTDLVAAPTNFLTGRYGRLRSVLALDDHTILVTTSNQDGRIAARAGDDRIIKMRVS